MPAEPDFKPWRCNNSQRRFPVPHPKPNKHWKQCHKLVQKYDEDMFDAWKGEVDNLLIFAGLFSATVTSFTVESYKWLDEASSDRSTQILALISLQLQQAFPNSSSSIIPTGQPQPFSVSSSAVRINIFWFLSLTLSMATVLIGILCMQWLREFKRDAARSHKDAIAIRQMRFEGLLQWKVPKILTLLSVLLQHALVLFFAGVLDLLWARNYVVALMVSVASGFVLLFLVGTTILPALQSFLTPDWHLRVAQCPYKSPQSWAFYRVSHQVVQLYRIIITWTAKIIFDFRRVHCGLSATETVKLEAQDLALKYNAGLPHFSSVRPDKNWNNYDIRWRHMRDATFFDDETGEPLGQEDGIDIIHGLKWINQTFSDDIDTVHFIFHCLLELPTFQAAQMVSELDPEVAYLVDLLFPDGSRQQYGSPLALDNQIREHISTVFLSLHKHIHPSLNQSYLECMIRLINTTSNFVPEVALRQSDNDLAYVSLETTIQLFSSLKQVFTHQAITTQHASDIFMLLLDVYLKDPCPCEPLLSLTFDIFEQFQAWLEPSENPPTHCERVETCVTGLIQVFASINSANIAALRTESSSFVKLKNLVSTLDNSVKDLEHKSPVLRGLNKRKWPDLRKIFLPS